MKQWRKVITLASALLMVGGVVGCASERAAEVVTTPVATVPAGEAGAAGTGTGCDNAGILVGVSMPTRALERWNNDGAHLQDLLQAAGYTVSLQYADNQVNQQISQIQNMVNDGAKVLVIAAIDGTALGPVLQTAADEGVSILAYDRLINDTPNVDYYATFDNELVGTMQGNFIVDALNLGSGGGPYNIEMFAGSPDDNNARFFFKGAYDVLKPYLDSGELVSPSGNVPASVDQWTQIGIQGWSSQTAQSQMENRLNSFYTGDERVDVVLSPNDSLALGITQALLGAGYTAADFPVLTGQDADVANVQNIIDGTQTMTVWKDTRTLGDQVARMVQQITCGQTVEVNDTESYDNGVKVVPSFLLQPQVIVKSDIQQYLIDSGFISASQVHGL